MATKFFFTDTTALIDIGSESKKIASTTQGASVANKVSTIPSALSAMFLTDGAGGADLVWFTNPLLPVAISGSNQLTMNLHGLESSMTVNLQFTGPKVERCDYGGNVISTLVNFNSSSAGSELGTGETTQNWTQSFLAGATLGYGNRLKFTLGWQGFGATNAGTGTFFYNGAAGATGDSFFSFVETIVEIPGGYIPDIVIPRYRYW